MKRVTYSLHSNDRQVMVSRLKAELAHEPAVAFAYLYGSSLDSDRVHDIDVGLYVQPSEQAHSSSVVARLAETLSGAVGPPVDLRILNDAPVAFLYHVLRGQLLACRDEPFLSATVEDVVRRYLDLAPLLRQSTMTLNPDLILARCAEIDSSLSRLEQLQQLPPDKFLANQDELDVACYRLLIAIEAALALCFHVSAKRLHQVPEEYAGCFAALERGGLIPADLSSRLQQMARFHKLLVHGYWRLITDKSTMCWPHAWTISVPFARSWPGSCKPWFLAYCRSHFEQDFSITLRHR